MVEIRGSEFPLWAGDFLVGSLRGMALHRLRRNGEMIVYDETIPLNDSIRDIVQRPDGQLLIYTNNGELIFIRDARKDRPNTPVKFTGLGAIREIWSQTSTGSAEGSTPVERGNLAFRRAFGSCQSATGNRGAGPHLKGVMGRDVGSVENFSYSAALASSDLKWSDALMERYLTDPRSVFPGSTMPRPQVTPEDMGDVIAYLRSVK